MPLFILILVLEVGLRISGTYKTYSEQISGYYFNYYGQTERNHYHNFQLNDTIIYDEPEMYIKYPSNSFGLREKEIATKKDTNVYRILTIGDSFTEGHGATYEETWPRFLENMLNERNISCNYEVINAGNRGSDIFFMHRFLQDHLIEAYDPDLVLIMLNSSDLGDIVYRGGESRFLEDGTAKFRSAPWFEPMFHFSHIFRAYVGERYKMDENLLTQEQINSEYKNAANLFVQEIISTKETLTRLDINSTVMYHPYPNTFKYFTDYNTYIEGMAPNDDYYNRESVILDPVFQEVTVSLVQPSFEKMVDLPLKSIAWPINGHFNGAGYKILSEIAYEELLRTDSTMFNNSLCPF